MFDPQGARPLEASPTTEISRLAARLLDMWRTPGPKAASIAELRHGYDATLGRLAAAGDAVVTESSAGGVRSLAVRVRGVPVERRVLYLHGGGYVSGRPEGTADLASRLAGAARAEVMALDYRLAPEHPHPAAVEDAVAAYRFLLGRGIAPGRIALAGDSAGGGLAVGTLVALAAAGLPAPAGAVCFSPWLDLALAGASLRTRAAADTVVDERTLVMCAEAVLAGQDPRTPTASPVYADLSRLPPLLLQVGSDEVLLDDSTRLAERARAAGVDVTLEIVAGMPHVFQFFASVLPEADAALGRAAAFIVRTTETQEEEAR